MRATLTCLNDHPVKTRDQRIDPLSYPPRCPVCGCVGRKWLRQVPWRVTLRRRWQLLRALLQRPPAPAPVPQPTPPPAAYRPPALHSRD